MIITAPWLTRSSLFERIREWFDWFLETNGKYTRKLSDAFFYALFPRAGQIDLFGGLHARS